jgi:hypothetical protein
MLAVQHQSLNSMPPALAHGWILRAAFCFLLGAIAMNALVYAAKVANPVIVSDSWHFVRSVVMPYAMGDFEVGDLFAKRGATDHSQPLRKALLILNYEWFDLDFSIDALIGVMAAFISLLLIWCMVMRREASGTSQEASRYVAFLALAGSYLSLSSPVVFSWPLVTTSYTNHPFILLYAWSAWRVLEHGSTSRSIQLLAAGTFLCVIADDTGLLATIAISLATLLHGILTRSIKAPLRVILLNAASYTGYSFLYAMVSATPDAVGMPGVSAATALSSFSGSVQEIWNVASAPLAGSIAHRSDLRGWSDQPLAIALATAMLLAAHAWFWWSSLRGRRNTATFVATSLMLLFYGLLAGVFLARVSQHGLDYFWQPRYSVFYRWNLVAIFLMLLGQLRSGADEQGRELPAVALRPVLLLAGVLLLLQIPLTMTAWERAPYIENNQRKQAAQIVSIAANPEILPERCISGIIVCRFHVNARREILWFLESQNLNVFNEEIRRRHEFGPMPIQAID